ncbi:tRNA-dihydrouridine(20a/20b) synthase [NAD(P)+]-like [Strongylocentrotus purpuratus]|uniref:tRNA-dihydrouridine(20a/20b) synthase [NAD(P)+]-like n=1 Tax=Strongylocentrotus purpuratus TaxID=7668 RepID=A0A7M7REC1_STRPU|nr:tRNA-dihydrouridine(20a/20b) synthase [NAD(P)+]-like [Strongylocentrotus purpuratus]
MEKATHVSPLQLFQSKEPVKMCAPMVRYSKLAFRTLVRSYDCDLTFTPMIVCDSFLKSAKARDSEFTSNEGDRPLIVQFAASNAKDLADAAELVARYTDGVDLNCGCPQRWAVAEGYGACLIKHPDLIKDMVQQTWNRVDRSDFTTSIKIRLHKDIRETVELCRRAEHAGVSWITVHGRTKEQRGEPADHDAIRIIKEGVGVPVVANGDVKLMEDVRRIVEQTGVDGVMSARGILRNPAMYAGYDDTPFQCIQDWVDIGLSLGTNLTYFHHHLMQMLDQYLPGSEKVNFNSLTSTTAVLDYLETNFGIGWNPNKNFYTRNKEDLGCHSHGQSRILGKDHFEKFIDECTEDS